MGYTGQNIHCQHQIYYGTIDIMVKKILCPWHVERTPSCAIYPERLEYRCFGCGRSGPLGELPDSELSQLDVSDFIPKPKEDIADSLEYIRSLPKVNQRGLMLHTDHRAFYLVWPDGSYYLKRYTDGSEPKYRGPVGHDRPIYRANTARSSTLVLVEGELNAASIGMCVDANVISVGGTGNFKASRLVKHLSEWSRYETIVMLLDDDPAGVLAALDAEAYFRSINKGVKVCLLKQDMNWVIQYEGHNEVKRRMEVCLGRRVA